MSGSADGASLSLGKWIAAMVALTILAVGMGGFFGIELIAKVKRFEQKPESSTVAGPQPKYGGDVGLLDLPPIIANLAEPSNAWVRLQTSIVYDKMKVAKPELLAAKIAQDILAYMKTVTVAQLAGASGLEHLREDLNERASIRSDGHVRELIIETLVVQ
jgi:flagellar FliL protein